MWLIYCRSDPENKITLVGGKKYVVGRQNCDIAIADASVSRCQAEICMMHHETNVMKSFINPTLTLHDVSKFGTFVNGKCLKTREGGMEVTLQDGDEIKFGGSPVSVYSVSYTPFITTTSCIEKAPKKDLVQIMCKLGGHLVREWRPNCELLIMSKINVTIKVVCALNSQKHIVTPSYLNDLHAYHLGQKEKPDPMDYLPDVVDQEVPQGVSFHPDDRRITLLTGLKFYFLSALQFNKTNLAVSTAGGQPILLEDGTEEDIEAMVQESTVVVSVSRDLLNTLSLICQKFVRLVCNTLSAHNLRMISDPEVGWAILTCNIEKFCNPTSEITPSMYANVASQMTQQSSSQLAQSLEALPGKRSYVKDADEESQVPSGENPSKRSRAENHDQHDASAHVGGREQDMDRSTSHISIDQTREKSQQLTSVNELSQQLTSVNELSLNSSSPENGPDKLTKSDAGENSSHKESMHSGASGSDENDNVVIHERSRPIRASSLSGDLFLDSGLQAAKSYPDLSNEHRAKGLSESVHTEQDNQTVSVFAQKRNVPSKLRVFLSVDSDEDDTIGRKSKKTLKRKPAVFSFHNDGENSEHSNKAQLADNCETGAVNHETGARSKDKPSGLFDIKHCETWTEDVRNLQSRDITSVQLSNTEPQTESQTEPHTELDRVEVKPKVCELPSEWLNVTSETRVKPEPLEITSSHSGEKGAASTSVDSSGGNHSGGNHSGGNHSGGNHSGGNHSGGNQDIKNSQTQIETHLILDNNGIPVKHFCEVKVVSLLARPIGSQRGTTTTQNEGPSHSGSMNFKNFKKTSHAGSGRLPTIIGGRDLEVCAGDRHRDIEHLFSMEADEENQRKEEEIKATNLFEWDTRKSRKTGPKRTR